MTSTTCKPRRSVGQMCRNIPHRNRNLIASLAGSTSPRQTAPPPSNDPDGTPPKIRQPNARAPRPGPGHTGRPRRRESSHRTPRTPRTHHPPLPTKVFLTAHPRKYHARPGFHKDETDHRTFPIELMLTWGKPPTPKMRNRTFEVAPLFVVGTWPTPVEG